jgi:two-component system, sensor histidine kinase
VNDLKYKIDSLENATILVADDSHMNQTIIEMLFIDSNINIEFADDGLICITMFMEKEYDLILMDIQMPNMGGIEATKVIRKLNRTIPIIGLSAGDDQKVIENALHYGMNDYMSKPLDVDASFTILCKALKV